MFELTQPAFVTVLPLLHNVKQAVVPFSVCEGRNPGRVFVDHADHPASALIWLSCGYLYLVGEPGDALSLESLAHLLIETLAPAWQAAGESGFILAPFSAAWDARLLAFLKDRAHEKIYRRTFTFHPERFAVHRNWAERVPAGFVMQRMDKALVERMGGLPSWASTQDFLARGIGYCLLKGHDIASACTTVFAASTGVEIDVHTDETYRGQGLATLTAAALIADGLRGGRQPNWECFWENEPSCALARKLGFEMKEDYPVYYWEPE